MGGALRMGATCRWRDDGAGANAKQIWLRGGNGSCSGVFQWRREDGERRRSREREVMGLHAWRQGAGGPATRATVVGILKEGGTCAAGAAGIDNISGRQSRYVARIPCCAVDSSTWVRGRPA